MLDVELLVPITGPTDWDPYGTLMRDKAHGVVEQRGGISPGSESGLAGVGQGQPGGVFELGQTGKLSLMTAMDLIDQGLQKRILDHTPEQTPPQVILEPSVTLSYVRGRLDGTGFDARSQGLEVDALIEDLLSTKLPSMLEVLVRYDGQGHATAYARDCQEQGAFTTVLLLRNVSQDGQSIIFDNPVDADGEQQLPLTFFSDRSYWPITTREP
jgi:hypothetical protein